MTRKQAQEIIDHLWQIEDAAKQVQCFFISPIVGAKMKDIEHEIKEIRWLLMKYTEADT